MAFENLVHQVPGLIATGDLSTYQNRFVKMTTTALTVDVAGAGDLMIGVLQNKPAAAGRAAQVAGIGSVVKVTASAAITAGDKVGAAANGKARTAVDNDWMAGIALDAAAADGDLITVYLCAVSLGIDDDT